MAHFVISQLSNIMASMGTTPQRALRDTDVLSNLTRTIMPANLNTNNEYEQGGKFSKFAGEIERARAANERDRFLPPIQVPELPRYALLAEFSGSSQSRSFGKARGGGIHTRQTYIGTTPAFSNVKLGDLQRINISDMMVKKRHNGTYLLCRIISKTSHVVATNVAIEDPSGDTTKLAIYHYPYTLDASADEADTLFPIGAILALREPYYKLSLSGEQPMIRIDSPSDIVFLDAESSLTDGVHWKMGATIPHTPHNPGTALGWKERGIEEFKKQRWLCAAIAFSEGLRLESNHHLLLLNRAETYLRMGWFNSAALDAEVVVAMKLGDPQLVRKAVVRAAKAYYSLGKYKDTLRLTNTLPNDFDAKALSTKARRRLHEKDTGDYNWLEVFKECQGRAARPDIADYCGPVEVKKPPNGPRGLFVTRDVKIGELLLVAKPLASYYPEDNPNYGKELFTSMNFLTNKMGKKAEYALIDRVIQRIWDDANLALLIGGMHTGLGSSPAGPYPVLSVDAVPLLHPRIPVTDVDVARIEAVYSTNAFGMDGRLIQSLDDDDDESKLDDSSALYGLPSFCNHSCLSTANRAFFGDVMVVRAKQNLKAGDEVTLSYVPLEFRTAEDKVKRIKDQWGFTCQCPICLADVSDTPAARSRRSQLTATRPQRLTVLEGRRIVDQLKCTYDDTRERQACGVKPELFTANSLLAPAYRTTSLEGSIRASMDALEAVGLLITDRSISGRFSRNSGQLPIDPSKGPGLVDTLVTHVVIQMASTFLSIGEQQRACNWLKVAVWVEDLSFGGGHKLFFERFKLFLETAHLIASFRRAFTGK